jgi:hypothetical protein
MSFWSTSAGEDLTKQPVQREYEAPAGDALEPIPDGSTVLAYIKEAKWDKDKNDNRYVKIRWDVLEPASVAKRVVFQKLWVLDDDPNAKDAAAANKKRDNALKMLMAIDANCSGKLAAKGSIPSDDDLALALTSASMLILCKVWSMKAADGSEMSGNWIAGVFPKGSRDVKVPEAAKKPAPGFDDLGDDIPFD